MIVDCGSTFEIQGAGVGTVVGKVFHLCMHTQWAILVNEVTSLCRKVTNTEWLVFEKVPLWMVMK